MLDYVVDPIVQDLACGIRKPVWGLSVVTFNPCPEIMREPYERFCEDLRKIDVNNAVYFYPFEAFHSTTMTASAFHKGSLSRNLVRENEKDITAKRNAWKNAFYTIFNRVMNAQRSVPKRKYYSYIYTRPTISPAAGFFFLEEHSDEIQQVRQKLAEEFGFNGNNHTENTMAQELIKAEYILNDYIEPQIKHTTFMRYVGVPDVDFDTNFKIIADKWKSVRWTSSSPPPFTLVEEALPYMHIEDKHRLLTR
eukprot:CFRG1572T1